MRKLLIATLFLATLSASGLAADSATSATAPNQAAGHDWPQWGGMPYRNMASDEKGLPAWFQFGRSGTSSTDSSATALANVFSSSKNVKWVANLGGGQTCGSPVVSQGRVLIGHSVQNQGCLFCFDEQTGRELGRFLCPPPKDNGGKSKTGGSAWKEGGHWGIASTPTVEDHYLYFVSPCQEVLCLDLKAWLEQGRDDCIVWKYDLAKELSAVQHHVSSCSVLVHGDYVYVCTGNGRWQGANSKDYYPLAPSLIALNKHTGQLVARDDEQIGEYLYRGQYGSPSLGLVNGKTQIFFGAGNGVCYAFEPVDPAAPVPLNQFTTTTLRGPIVKFIDVKHQDVSISSSLQTPSPNSLLPLEIRYSIDLPALSPSNAVPTARVPDVPCFKKIWWCDCLPEEYKKNPFYVLSAISDGKGRPCEITATPVFYRNRVYIAIGGDSTHGSQGSKGNLVCIDAAKTGNLTQTGRLWNYDRMNQSVSTVAIADGLVYALDEDAVLNCLDADTGHCYWTQKVLKGAAFNSPLVADGKVFAGRFILAAGKELKVISENILPNAPFSTPCVAHGVLFLVADNWRLWAICDKGDRK